MGQENFTDLLIDLVCYSYDASDHNDRPEAAIWPTNSEQVSRILAFSNQNGLPVTPRGAGTGLCGGAVPAHGGLILDMCRMNRILEVQIPDRLVVVEPGVVYADLEKALNPYGFFFPPDPASGSVCTIGGNVATNAGGIRGAKYGVTRDYVLGLEVVLADGRVMRTGSRCIKSASGYNLTQIFVGSEGTLGVITEVTLKIHPKPTSFKTCLSWFSSLNDAGRAAADIMHSRIIPSALEIFDENTIRVLREYGEMALPEAVAMILCETDGYTDAETVFQMEKVVEVFRRSGAIGTRMADSPEEVEAWWKTRKSIGSMAAQLGTSSVSEDVAVPISKLTELLRGISGIVRHYELPFVVFGHVGDGNLHPRIMFDRSDPGQFERVKKAVDAIFRLTCELGGTLTGEHGIGLAKAPYFKLEHGPTAVERMRALKRMFDPKNILNPGKMGLEAETVISD